MGIKDNFQQALRELTGTEKEDAKRGSSVDAIKNAVSAGDGSEYDTVGGSYDEIQKRAAAAADEMTRQQSAYLDVTYHADNSGNSGFETEQGNITMDGITAGEDMTEPLQISEFDRDTDSVSTAGGFIRPQQSSERAGGNDRQTQRTASDPFAGSPYAAGNQSSGSQTSGNQYSGNRYAGNSYGGNQYGGGQYNGNPYGGNQYGGNPYQGAGQMPRPNTPAGGSSDGTREQIFGAARYRQNTGSDDDEITVISKNTVIDGNVRSFANMSIDGNIKGNVETTKDIDLNGKIVGNIACNNAQMRTSQIQGNVQLKGNVYMERDTLLIGDLSSTYADINGKIKGNVAITGKAELRSDAVIFGDISASTITVNDGAIIQGYVSTTFLNKEESKNIFPDTITIGE